MWWHEWGWGETRLHDKIEMKGDKMRWDEMRWDEMRVDEMRWDEMCARGCVCVCVCVCVCSLRPRTQRTAAETRPAVIVFSLRGSVFTRSPVVLGLEWTSCCLYNQPNQTNCGNKRFAKHIRAHPDNQIWSKIILLPTFQNISDA